MSLQINGAIAPAGLISGAKTYSVILNEDGLYLIHVGPAATNVYSYNPLERWLNEFLGARAAKKIAVGEARLAELGEAALVGEKHNVLLTAADVKTISFKQPGSSLILSIKSHKGNYKLIFKQEVRPYIEQIVAALS